MLVRQEHEANFATLANLRQRILERAPGRFAAGGIAVERKAHVVREPKQSIQMVRRGGGAQSGNRVVEPGARQANHVHIAFDDHQTVNLPQRLAGFVEAVQLTAFVEQYGLRRVQVFRLVVANDTAAKADRAATAIADGKHDSAPEPIVVSPVVATNDEADGQQPFDGARALSKLVEHLAPRVGRVANAEALRGCTVDAAVAQILDGDGRRFQGFLIVPLDAPHQLIEFIVPLRRSLPLVARDFDAQHRCQGFDGFNE